MLKNFTFEATMVSVSTSEDDIYFVGFIDAMGRPLFFRRSISGKVGRNLKFIFDYQLEVDGEKIKFCTLNDKQITLTLKGTSVEVIKIDLSKVKFNYSEFCEGINFVFQDYKEKLSIENF